MEKIRYEEPTIDILELNMTSDIITWSNGDPDNLEKDSWDDF